MLEFEREEIERKVEKLLEPLLKERGLTLVDIELKGLGNRKVLRIFIDKAGGVTIEDCRELSEEFSLIMDVEDPIPGSYILEVSSPGLNRVLKKEREFIWAKGKKVRIVSKNGEYSGYLYDYKDGNFLIEIEGKIIKLKGEDVLKIQLDEIGEIS